MFLDQPFSPELIKQAMEKDKAEKDESAKKGADKEKEKAESKWDTCVKLCETNREQTIILLEMNFAAYVFIWMFSIDSQTSQIQNFLSMEKQST